MAGPDFPNFGPMDGPGPMGFPGRPPPNGMMMGPNGPGMMGPPQGMMGGGPMMGPGGRPPHFMNGPGGPGGPGPGPMGGRGPPRPMGMPFRPPFPAGRGGRPGEQQKRRRERGGHGKSGSGGSKGRSHAAASANEEGSQADAGEKFEFYWIQCLRGLCVCCMHSSIVLVGCLTRFDLACNTGDTSDCSIPICDTSVCV